ncbi:MAG: PAS domain S-box protein [Opitutaceae bacterium]
MIDDNPSIHVDFRKTLCSPRFYPVKFSEADESFDDAALKIKPSEFEITSAYQGERGLAAVREAMREGRPFSVAFVDMRMPPGWDGVETTSRLWEVDPDLQVVICSAYMDYSWEELVARLGTSDRLLVLKKPFDMIEVQQLAHVMAEKRMLLQQVRHHMAHLEETVKLRTQELVRTQTELLADITQRKQAESGLRKLSRAVEQSPVSIVITDINGAIEYVNPKFCAVTGYSFEDVRGRNPRVLKSGEMPSEAYRQLWATITAGEEWRGEFHNKKKNGELFWESASISPIRDDLGGITHFVAVKEDITGRKKSEAALREAEERYRSLFERSLDCMYVHDFEGRFMDFNPASLTLLGYQREELTALTFSSLIVAEHIPRAWRVVEEIRAGGTQSAMTELSIVRKDGTLVDVEVKSALVLRDGQPYAIQGIACDITLRKRAAEALMEQLALRERLSKLAANAPGVIYSFRQRPDGSRCFPYASPTIEEFLGVRAEALTEDASPIFELVHPDDMAHLQSSIAESARTLLTWSIEFRMRHPVKGLFWVSCQTTPEREADGSILWHGFMSDITGRKRAEDALRQKEYFLSESQRLGHIGSWFDDKTGPFTLSDEMYRIFGVSPGTFVPTVESLLGLIHPDDRQAVQEWLVGCATGKRRGETEFRIGGPDGTTRFIKANGEAVYDAENRIIHMAGAVQDITEQTRAAQLLAELKLNEERARRTLELEHVSRQSHFVAMVSHEFRTPLGVINTAAHLLGRYLDRMNNGERASQIREIQGSVERMTQMMEDLLLHGEFETGRMECKPAHLDVEALCRQLVSDTTQQFGAARQVDCMIDPAVHMAFLDEKLFRHILENLLSNAVKYSSDDQTVTLEVSLGRDLSQFEGQPVPSPGDHLHLKVADTGIGIPPPDLARLFESFHRAANVGDRPGSGMGLAIVKQCVDLHRGLIRIESTVGRGTIVRVWLPLSSPGDAEEFPKTR